MNKNYPNPFNRTVAITVLFILAFAVCAQAGILDVVKDTVLGSTTSIIVWVIATVLGVVMKVIPNEKIKAVVGGLMYGLGVTVTAGLSKWPWTAPIWNKTIEPFVIDLIDNTIVHGAAQFIKGMRSDES
jgi:hypothetical protein